MYLPVSTNMAIAGTSPFLIGDTSSNCCFSIVMLFFEGVIEPKQLNCEVSKKGYPLVHWYLASYPSLLTRRTEIDVPIVPCSIAMSL